MELACLFSSFFVSRSAHASFIIIKFVFKRYDGTLMGLILLPLCLTSLSSQARLYMQYMWVS